MSGLRHERAWNALGIGFVLLVIYLSLGRAPSEIASPAGANVGHVIAYFWLMIWFAQLHSGVGRRMLLAVAFVVLGIVLELIQGTTGYRHFDPLDMGLNALGAGAGLAAARTPLQHALRRFEGWLHD